MKKTAIILAFALSLQAAAQTEITDSLQLIPGVRVSRIDGSDADDVRIDIRGLSSLRAGQQPLWIVDGTILSTSLPYSVQPFAQYGDAAYAAPFIANPGLNIQDIASIEVLKNTAATARFGSLGANGVIVVTTKKATSERPQVDWTSRMGVHASEISSDAFSPSVSHSHYLAVGSAGKRSHFRISAFLTDKNGVVKGNGKDHYGVRASFGAGKTDVIDFGAHASLYKLNTRTQSGAAWYGSPSFTLTARSLVPNAAGWLADFDNERNTLRTAGDVFFKLKLTHGLYWDNRLSADFQALSQYLWYGNGTAFGKAQNGAASIINSQLLFINGESFLRFSRYFAQLHHLEVNLGAVYRNQLDNYNTMTGTNFVSHELRARGLTMMESRARIRHFNQNLTMVGGQAQLHYVYNGLAGADLACTIEPCLVYDKGVPATDYLYPSVTLFADLKKWLAPASSVLSQLRLDAGFGIAGRCGLVPYEMLPLYTSGAYPVVDDDRMAYYTGFNRVRNTEIHVGASAGFLSNTIQFSALYYDRTVRDALSIFSRENREMTRISSEVSVWAARGVELALQARLFHIGATSMHLRVNADYNFSRLMKVAPGDATGLRLNSYALYANVNREGLAPGALYGWILDENNTAIEEGALGNTLPCFNGGAELSLQSGPFSLSIFATGAAGFKILNLNRMLASGQEYVSSAFVEKGDYLKLSKVSLGYDIPLKAKWIQGLKLLLSADNLLVATAYSGWSPEVNSFGYTPLANGLDYGSFPRVRTFVLGISAKF